MSCAYFNTFYNAQKSYDDALKLSLLSPDYPSATEQNYLEEAVEGATRILTDYSSSRWVDDAQLLLGDALYLLGKRTLTGSGTSDFEEAMMAYTSAISLTEDIEIRERAHIGHGLAAMELLRLNEAEESFAEVSTENTERYFTAKLLLIEVLILRGLHEQAIAVIDTLQTPGSDSLAAELNLILGQCLIEAGYPDSGAVVSIEAGDMFGRGKGRFRAYTAAADGYLKAGKPSEAASVLDVLLAGYRSDVELAQIALLNGFALELDEDTTGALQSYSSATELDNVREWGTEALYRRALLLEYCDRIEEAIDVLTELKNRPGDYVWIRIGEGRLHHLQRLYDYTNELSETDESEIDILRLMIAEKRIDLYGYSDERAIEELTVLSMDASDMERALALTILANIPDIDADSAEVMLLTAYELSSEGDLATSIEERLGLERGDGYEERPSVALCIAWENIENGRYEQAWESLDALLDSPWSRMIRNEVLWAAYIAGERTASVDADVLEDYLLELSEEYPKTEEGEAAVMRLGGEENEDE